MIVFDALSDIAFLCSICWWLDEVGAEVRTFSLLIGDYCQFPKAAFLKKSTFQFISVKD